ncbi:Sybindin-like family-domain-containing protein [Dichotomocladium elegans]|nr:Sybindin-like family-domain-containing protein [Dichotomocladium elegans]
MTIHNLYIFDRHCQCIYYQKWNHKVTSTGTSSSGTSAGGISQSAIGANTTVGSNSRLGGLTTTSSSRFSASSPGSSAVDHGQSSSGGPSMARSGDDRLLQTQPSGLAAGSVISIEEEAKLVYGVIYSLRNFVRKLSANQDEFISYRTSTYRLHYYETPTGLKFVMNSDANTESLRAVLKQIYVQLYVDFVVKNGLMKFEDTRWEISQGLLPPDQQQQQQPQPQPQQQSQQNGPDASTLGTATRPAAPPPGNISNELFRIAVDRFIRSLPVFE